VQSSSQFEFAGTPRFEILRRLGAGGMGVVYQALDREHGNLVALKVLRRVSAQGVYRFKREFRALQDIEHPNLCRLGELIEHRGEWFFTMELVEGVDFVSYVVPAPPCSRGAHRFDEGRLRSAFGQLALGLTALHSASRVHRDVKPSNILVTRDDRVVLLDFGLSIDSSGGDQSSVDNIVGTPEYMAPEQAASKPVGPAADWYSAGVVLYQALTGKLPFVGKALEIFMDKQRHEPAPPRARAPGVARDLDSLCIDLLRFDPAARPGGVEILQRLGITGGDARGAMASSQFSQTTPFVGRESELESLRAAFDSVERGRAVTVFVRGESGVGKSELVRHFTGQLLEQDDSLVLLTGRCYERESVPYKAFDGIADNLSRELVRTSDFEVARVLPDNAALLGQLFPVLRRVEGIASAGRRKQTVDPHELRARMFDSLRQLFARMTERRRVVLVVDDFQWADGDSLTLLRELLHPPDPPPVLLLATIRAEQPEMLERFAFGPELVGHDIHVLDVADLSMKSSRELVSLLSPVLARDRPEVIDTVAQEAGGHPLFILELVRHLDEGADDAGAVMRLDDALWSRVTRLPPRARELLETVCVAGAPITQEVARHATRADYEESEKCTSVLRVAYFVRTAGARDSDTIEPYHDRVREAVLAHLDEPTRDHHHERLAIALERAGAGTYDPQVLVRHLEASGKAADASQRAEEAARRAADALAFDRAAELYKAVLRLGVEANRRNAVERALADALTNAGRGLEAAEAYLVAAQGAAPAGQLECRRFAAEQLLRSGHIDRGMKEYKGLLGQVDISLPETPRRALMSLLWCRLRLRLRGLRWKQKHESEVSAAELVRVDTYGAVGHALAMVDNIRGADFQSRSLLEALRCGELRRIMLALSAEAIYLSSQGRRGQVRGRYLLERARNQSQDLDDPLVDGWQLAADGIMSYFEGRFADSAQILERAVEHLRTRTTGAIWELDTTRMFRMFALKHAGGIRGAQQLYSIYVRDAARRGDRYMETTTRRYAGFLWLAQDKPQEALRDIEIATWTPPEGRFHLQHWFEIEGRADVALYDGTAEGALVALEPRFGALETSLLSRVQIVRSLSIWLRGRLHAGAAEEQGDTSRLRDVERLAKRLERERTSYAAVWASLLRAAERYQRGDDDAAVAHLRWAADAAEAKHLGLCCLAARRALGTILGGDEGRELVADADAALGAEQIAKPERMVRFVAPGLARRRP